MIDDIGDNVIAGYTKLFSTYSIKNVMYGRLLLHALLGQLFSNIKISIKKLKKDLRVHPFFVQDSGSGKSSGLSFISRLAKTINIPIKIHSGDINEASFVGSFDKMPIETVTSSGKKIIRDEIVQTPGYLAIYEDGGILFFEEAEFILKAAEREYNILLLNYFQSTMNPIGDPSHVVERSLKHGNIILHPECTFIFTSPLVKIKISDVMRLGFFQRTVPFFRKLEDDEWDSMAYGVISNIGKKDMTFSDEVETYSMIVSHLRELKDFSKKVDKVFLSLRAQEQLKKFYSKYKSMISNVDGRPKEILDSFRIRGAVNVSVLAAHRALLSKRTTITASDVIYAEEVILSCMKSIMEFMERTPEMLSDDVYEVRFGKIKKSWYDIVNKVEAGETAGSLKRKEFVEYIEKFLGVSTSSAYRYVDEWISRGYLVEDGNKDIMRHKQ